MIETSGIFRDYRNNLLWIQFIIVFNTNCGTIVQNSAYFPARKCYHPPLVPLAMGAVTVFVYPYGRNPPGQAPDAVTVFPLSHEPGGSSNKIRAVI